MDEKRKQGLAASLTGLAAGLLNGGLGTGGGLLLVPALRRWAGLDTKRAHATSVAVMAVLSAVSAAFYLAGGQVTLQDARWYMLGGALGGLGGGLLMNRIPAGLLRRVFGAFIVYAGVRLLLG